MFCCTLELTATLFIGFHRRLDSYTLRYRKRQNVIIFKFGAINSKSIGISMVLEGTVQTKIFSTNQKRLCTNSNLLRNARRNIHFSCTVYVYIYINIYICLYKYTYMYIYIYIYTYIYIYMNKDTCVYMHIYIYILHTYALLHASNSFPRGASHTHLHICVSRIYSYISRKYVCLIYIYIYICTQISYFMSTYI